MICNPLMKFLRINDSIARCVAGPTSSTKVNENFESGGGSFYAIENGAITGNFNPAQVRENGSKAISPNVQDGGLATDFVWDGGEDGMEFKFDFWEISGIQATDLTLRVNGTAIDLGTLSGIVDGDGLYDIGNSNGVIWNRVSEQAESNSGGQLHRFSVMMSDDAINQIGDATGNNTVSISSSGTGSTFPAGAFAIDNVILDEGSLSDYQFDTDNFNDFETAAQNMAIDFGNYIKTSFIDSWNDQTNLLNNIVNPRLNTLNKEMKGQDISDVDSNQLKAMGKALKESFESWHNDDRGLDKMSRDLWDGFEGALGANISAPSMGTQLFALGTALGFVPGIASSFSGVAINGIFASGLASGLADTQGRPTLPDLPEGYTEIRNVEVTQIILDELRRDGFANEANNLQDAAVSAYGDVQDYAANVALIRTLNDLSKSGKTKVDNVIDHISDIRDLGFSVSHNQSTEYAGGGRTNKLWDIEVSSGSRELETDLAYQLKDPATTFGSDYYFYRATLDFDL